MVSQPLKWRAVRDYPCEQGDGGVELEIIGMTEDVADGAAVDSIDQGGAVAKPLAKRLGA